MISDICTNANQYQNFNLKYVSSEIHLIKSDFYLHMIFLNLSLIKQFECSNSKRLFCSRILLAPQVYYNRSCCRRLISDQQKDSDVFREQMKDLQEEREMMYGFSEEETHSAIFRLFAL